MAIHIFSGVKIHTSFDYQPIPIRNMDWSAVTDDYDCDCDQDGFFSTSPHGHGATEQEAIADLIEQLRENDEDGLIEGSDAWNEANGQFGVGA
jgi:hypothetical protein